MSRPYPKVSLTEASTCKGSIGDSILVWTYIRVGEMATEPARKIAMARTDDDMPRLTFGSVKRLNRDMRHQSVKHIVSQRTQNWFVEERQQMMGTSATTYSYRMNESPADVSNQDYLIECTHPSAL